jgi:two-component system nitrate/nitrite response regulator NarL
MPGWRGRNILMLQTVNQAKIRLLVADDHPVVRAGIRSFLSNNDRVEIVGEASDGREAINKARELHPDVVFMDTYMPRMNGLIAAKLICQQEPGIKVLMHSVHNGHEYVLQMIRSGARGYVLKNASLEELPRAIERINQGEGYFNSEEARQAFDEHSKAAPSRKDRRVADLSEREMEVLGKIAEGRSNREIAAEFGLSVRTIETHRERIMQKLQIHNVAGLIKYAITHGVTSIE